MWNTEFGSGQQAGGFLNTTSSPASAEKKRPERISNVVPITIAKIHLMNETDENVKVGSITARIVTFVGLLKSVDVQSTKVTFVVDDMTGLPIEVQVWLGENEESEKKIRTLRENTYVRVTGAVRSMKGRRHVIAFKIVPIKEVNEISMHILEVVHTSMAIAMMDKQEGSTSDYSMTGVKAMGNTSSSSMSASAMGGFSNSSGGSLQNNMGLSKPQLMVFQAITASNDMQGISINDLFTSVKGLNRNQIKDAIDFLSVEGHIYTTIDEEHFRSTDNM